MASLRLSTLLLLASSFAASSALAGCTVASNDSASSNDAITDVKQTPVKDQSIGNCWTYATTGWVESLAKTASGKDLNLSESYVSYWHWYGEIVRGELDTRVAEGGTFGEAAELMLHYGMMNEGDFIPAEAQVIRSGRQATALAAINASLKDGALKAPEARADRALVRKEMDKAWGLDAAVVGYLDKTFGADVSKDLVKGAVPANVPIHAVKDYPAKLQDPATKEIKDATVADALGTASAWGPETREGNLAWSQVNYPDDAKARRDFQKRVQRALHDSQPVMMIWYVAFNALNDKGQFFAPPATPGSQGGHMTILQDYEITNVPGFGTLPAGTLETRPDALAAALADEATIRFFRIKNSWGDYHSSAIVGYHDLYMTYLNGPIKICETDADEKPLLDKCHDGVPLEQVVLPAGY